jgi:N-acetylmuramoyl-L-alanine amidase
MRSINKIIIHCSDTRIDQDFSIEDIRKWHKLRGFNDVGYHYYIKVDGSLYNGRSIEKIGAHCKGQNSKSIGICFEGGKDEKGESWKIPSKNQIKTYRDLLKRINSRFGGLEIHGHYDFSKKSCPNFDVCVL